jgi:hypothetical protein
MDVDPTAATRRSTRLINQTDGVVAFNERVDNPEQLLKRRKAGTSRTSPMKPSPKKGFPFEFSMLYLNKQVSLSKTGVITSNSNVANPDLNQVWFTFGFSDDKLIHIGFPTQELFKLIDRSEKAVKALARTKTVGEFRSALSDVFYLYVDITSKPEELEAALKRLSVKVRLNHMLNTLTPILDFGRKQGIRDFVDEDGNRQVPLARLNAMVKQIQHHINDEDIPDATLMRHYEENTYAVVRVFMLAKTHIANNANVASLTDMMDYLTTGRSPANPVYSISDLGEFWVISQGLTIKKRSVRQAWGVQPASASEDSFMTSVDNRIRDLVLKPNEKEITDALVRRVAKRLWVSVVVKPKIQVTQKVIKSLADIAQTFFMRMLDQRVLLIGGTEYKQTHYRILDMFEHIATRASPGSPAQQASSSTKSSGGLRPA